MLLQLIKVTKSLIRVSYYVQDKDEDYGCAWDKMNTIPLISKPMELMLDCC